MKKYDLIVVGTSFAASFFLKKYLSKADDNKRVLVLERGFLFPHAERLKEQRGEKVVQKPKQITDHNSLITNNKEKPWRFQATFGGNSNCWVGCTPRFMPNDFKLFSKYGVGADWPVSYDDLAPYYDEVEDLMSISGPDETPFPRTKKYPQPPHQLTTVDQILHKTYGSLYNSQATARARVATAHRNACCVSNECKICPANAKFTIENSGLQVYDDKRVEMVFGAQVLQLDVLGDVVKKVIYLKDGKELAAEGEVTALAANAIFNSHILLNSGDTSPKLGKGIGEQVGVGVIVKLKDLSNVGGSTQVTANGYMLYDGEHRKHGAGCLIEANNGSYIRMERGKYRHIAVFRMVFEDLPEDRNYVSLSDDKLTPAVHYAGFSDYTKRGIENMKQKLPEIFSCLPVEDIEVKKPYDTESHILGTTRMSSNPADGVVDKNMIHHKYRNLFVLGSGAFTTYAPANPTLTLSTLSLYAADKSF